MKRIISIGLYLFSCICLVAQTTKTYTLEFDETDFTIAKSNGKDYIISDTQPLCYDEDTSLPEIPYLEINILLPENNTCSGFSYRIKDSVTIEEDITLKANSGVIPMSQISSVTPANKREYPQNNYPFEIKMLDEDIMDGYRYVALRVSPFSYNAKEKRLRYASEIELSIELEDAYLPHPATSFYGKKSIELMIKDLVINPEEFYWPKQRIVRTKSSNSIQNDTIKYLIVTSENLKNAFQTLANWKTAKGVKAKIETVEDIYDKYTGASHQIKIKKCIYDYKQQGLEYVLLGGDVDIVPAQGCYGKVTNSEEAFEDFHIPTDLFYSLFDGDFAWNADGDSIIGEIEDNVSFLFDNYVAISRLPVSTPQEVEIVVQKTINYELNPPSMGHNSMLLIGDKVHYYKDGHSDSEIQSMKMYNTYVGKYSPNVNLSFLFDTNTSYEGGASYELNPTNLQNRLAEGFHYIHVMTHGLPNLWELEKGEYLTSNAQSLCSSVPSILLTTSCYSNAFDKPYLCLSEAFIQNPQSGVVVFWGSSREGWGHKDSINHLHKNSIEYSCKFYRSLFRYKICRFGKIVTTVKDSRSPTSYDPYRWLHFSLNAIGDPELPIYIESPKSIEGLSWVHKDSNLYVTTNTTGCTITLSSANDNGDSYYHIERDTCRYTFQNVNALENYQLCITKDNYKPILITNLKSNVIIQNQTFNSTSIVTGDEIVIGRNISSAVEEGPVVIESGSTTFDATNSVTIKNGFECKIGATLEIK